MFYTVISNDTFITFHKKAARWLGSNPTHRAKVHEYCEKTVYWLNGELLWFLYKRFDLHYSLVNIKKIFSRRM